MFGLPHRALSQRESSAISSPSVFPWRTRPAVTDAVYQEDQGSSERAIRITKGQPRHATLMEAAVPDAGWPSVRRSPSGEIRVGKMCTTLISSAGELDAHGKPTRTCLLHRMKKCGPKLSRCAYERGFSAKRNSRDSAIYWPIKLKQSNSHSMVKMASIWGNVSGQ